MKLLSVLVCSLALVLLPACGEAPSQQAVTPTAVAAPTTNAQTPAAALPTDTIPADLQAAYSASARVDKPAPNQGSQVGVLGKLLRDGQPVEGAVMNTLWNFRSTKLTCDGARTQADGLAVCTENIASALPGYEVVINVSFVVDGKVVARTQTSFTPVK